MSTNFDLIVIGAGPAGSAAAFTAAQEGISVLLLEEHAEIGIPVVCAEALSRSTIEGYIEIKPEWISHELSGSILRGPIGETLRIEYPHVGWVLNRKVFDKALASMAQAHGAVIKRLTKAIGIEENKVIVNEDGIQKTYSFKFLIGADGVASNVGKWMGIDTRLALHEIMVCAQYVISNITLDPYYATLMIDEEYTPGGYAWIFPKSRNAANIGLGISPMKAKKSARHLLDQWVKTEFAHGFIKKKIFGGVPAKILKQFSGKNFFLVGDAARFADPLSGAGIANGIKSGVLAGRNAVLWLKGKKHYFEAEMKKEILNEIKFHERVRNIYMKLSNNEYSEIFKIGKKFFNGEKIDDINTHLLVKHLLLSSPRLLRIGFNLLF
ncbi:MAG: geranylgeranyl reductase family protein [candidate division WOR-3 bacterium]|nr:MAG: geranylgeranyl reductase family protein [candidate division WOR-3 bacterium]